MPLRDVNNMFSIKSPGYLEGRLFDGPEEVEVQLDPGEGLQLLEDDVHAGPVVLVQLAVLLIGLCRTEQRRGGG